MYAVVSSRGGGGTASAREAASGLGTASTRATGFLVFALVFDREEEADDDDDGDRVTFDGGFFWRFPISAIISADDAALQTDSQFDS